MYVFFIAYPSSNNLLSLRIETVSRTRQDHSWAIKKVDHYVKKGFAQVGQVMARNKNSKETGRERHAHRVQTHTKARGSACHIINISYDTHNRCSKAGKLLRSWDDRSSGRISVRLLSKPFSSDSQNSWSRSNRKHPTNLRLRLHLHLRLLLPPFGDIHNAK